MRAIVAVDAEWGIGKDNALNHDIPEDMAYFRDMTRGHVMLMGRKTLETFPGGRPLPHRTNIVLTHDENLQVEGAQVVHSLDEALEAVAAYPADEVYLIGGGKVYHELIDACDTAFVTKIEHVFGSDAFFPDLDARPGWECVEEGERHEHEGIGYRFCTYRRTDA